MQLYDITVPYLDKSLRNVGSWIDKAHEHATAKKVDPNTMLTARLAVDQYPLLRQVQSVCDQPKLLLFRCAFKEAPTHPDTETTWDELKTRIASVRELINGFKPGDFDESKLIELPFFAGKKLRMVDYVVEFALPNFNFHLVTTYALFRHLGVELGKKDFIGGLPFLEA